jgi:hypothetical protein
MTGVERFPWLPLDRRGVGPTMMAMSVSDDSLADEGDMLRGVALPGSTS